MSLIRVQDASNIVLPAEVGEALDLKNGDTVVVRVEGDRVVLEKSVASPVDEAFGIWPEIEDGVEYVNNLREEWEERGKRLGL